MPHLKKIFKYSMDFLTAAQLEVKVVKRNPPSHTDEKHLSESEAAPFIHVIVRHRAWRKHFQSVT